MLHTYTAAATQNAAYWKLLLRNLWRLTINHTINSLKI